MWSIFRQKRFDLLHVVGPGEFHCFVPLWGNYNIIISDSLDKWHILKAIVRSNDRKRQCYKCNIRQNLYSTLLKISQSCMALELSKHNSKINMRSLSVQTLWGGNNRTAERKQWQWQPVHFTVKNTALGLLAADKGGSWECKWLPFLHKHMVNYTQIECS